MIEVDDPVYSFNEVLSHIDLKPCFVEEKDHKTGRPKYDAEKLLKVILFAFMEEGYQALRKIQKLCKTDIRFLWLLDGEKAPSHMTICNFINHLYQKETANKKYRENPFRAVNFKVDEDGDLVYPNKMKFRILRTAPVKGNRYGRTEEIYQCEDCSSRSLKGQCSKAKGNRTIRLNEELTRFHEEVLNNLNCIHGALLCMNRSIQAEGAFGEMKWNRSYTRARRRGPDGLVLETALISCGFNLHKFHLKSRATLLAA